MIHGTYRVVRRLGAGSMGLVHEVEHLRLGKRFALKTLQPELAERPDVVRRFHREARAAAAIGHLGIVQVTDMGVLDTGEPFLVMELLRGRSLRDELREVGPLTMVRALDIAISCCDALAAAHSKSIVHRDLKPDNIFLVQSPGMPERVKILDFGISKFLEASALLGEPATRTGVLLGTPYYMSPEQLRGAPTIDQRTDVYAMAVVLFEMLTGNVPYKSPSLADLAMAVLMGPQPSIEEHAPGASKELSAIIRRAMAVDPEVRTHSIATLGMELSEVASQYRTETGDRLAPVLPLPSQSPGRGAEPITQRTPPMDRPTDLAPPRGDGAETRGHGARRRAESPAADTDRHPAVVTGPDSAPTTLPGEPPPEDPTEIAPFAFGDVEPPEPTTRPVLRAPLSGQDDLDDDQPTTILLSSSAEFPAAVRPGSATPGLAAKSSPLAPRPESPESAAPRDAEAIHGATLPIRASRLKLARTLGVAFVVGLTIAIGSTFVLWWLANR
ncbi:MAG: protein kinase [Deltaproteobacteria bacterium]|nr:protein kinase [Deltaproteobacteria bacterium]